MQQDSVYEESHRSRLMFGVSASIVAVPCFVLVMYLPTTLPYLIPTGVAGVLVLASIWKGFYYGFTKEGIDIRHIFGSSQFIPFADIENYSVQDCSPMRDFGGWGIRIGLEGKAYIWHGKQILRIQTHGGTFYLGHTDPEKLARNIADLTSS